MELLEIEIARHDWNAMQCGCGQSAAHLATDLRALAKAASEGEFDQSCIRGHVVSVVLEEPALAAVSVAMAALASDIPAYSRHRFTELVLFIVSGEGQAKVLTERGIDMVEECQRIVREGIWLLYQEIFSGRSVGTASYAGEVLSLIEEDEDRFARVLEVVRERLNLDL